VMRTERATSLSAAARRTDFSRHPWCASEHYLGHHAGCSTAWPQEGRSATRILGHFQRANPRFISTSRPPAGRTPNVAIMYKMYY
jgi:hypothetical protein